MYDNVWIRGAVILFFVDRFTEMAHQRVDSRVYITYFTYASQKRGNPRSDPLPIPPSPEGGYRIFVERQERH
jgi:hypothetical protein